MLVHLTTALPPVICGVGDYSLLLAKALRERGTSGNFLIGRYPPPDLPEVVERFHVEVLREHKSRALCRALEAMGADVVLLQFSGYGYAARGLCYWLAEGLSEWKGRACQRRVITMFHELYASGPPWRSSFWTMPLQRSIARQLAKLSDALVCGREEIADILARWSSKAIHVLPVFSNIGELQVPSGLAYRTPTAVIFGQKPLRERCWRLIWKAKAWLDRMGVKEIIDIGPGQCNVMEVPGIAVRTAGIWHPTTISKVLADARLGITSYEDNRLASSGTLAAFLAHGCAVLNLSASGSPKDRLSYGTHLLSPDDLRPDPEAVALAGNRWYQEHNLSQTAKRYAAILAQLGG